MDNGIFTGMIVLFIILSLWNLLSHIRIDDLEKQIKGLKQKH